MTTIPKHVFGVLERVASMFSARPGFGVALLGAIALGILPALPAAATPAVHLDATPAATAPWLSRLNAWRANVGLPNLSENTTWSAGDYDHALYMVKNDQVTHSAEASPANRTMSFRAGYQSGLRSSRT
jgi:hypothetical protein